MKSQKNTGNNSNGRAKENSSEGTSIFFFDGEIRTWEGVLNRARLNKALLSLVE